MAYTLPCRQTIGRGRAQAKELGPRADVVLTCAADVVLTCAADRAQVKELGPKMPEYGFSSFRKVPGSDGHYLGIKVVPAGP